MNESAGSVLESADSLRRGLADCDYLAGEDLVLTLVLAHRIGKPVLLEGPAGGGKTAVAVALARAVDTALIRLQCYEGLDAASSLYEWNHAKQILHIRLSELEGQVDRSTLEASIYDESFLLERPLLKAIRHPGPEPAVLLIDEVDRADEEFEAFLLEVLSEYQVSIPELGILRAKQIPLVVLTANNSRELSDALRRRCLYLWLDLPTPEQERAIVLRRVEGIQDALADQVVAAIARVRTLELDRPPGVAETLDWSNALVALGAETLSAETITRTRGCFLKSQADMALFAEQVGELFPSPPTGELQ